MSDKAAFNDESDCSAAKAADESTSENRAKYYRQHFLLPWLRLRVWLAERMPLRGHHLNLFYAALVGFIAGSISVGFRRLSLSLTALFVGQWPATEYLFESLSSWQRVLIPTVGGLIAGLFLWWGTKVPRTSSSSSTDYMEAIALGDGKMPFRASIVKSISALFTIASGGSIGREGPIVALAAMMASIVGKWTNMATPRLRLLVACGAAAGMACVQNAPIAGAFFVSEIVIGKTAIESFGPMVVSTVVATQTVRTFFGDSPLYTVPQFRLSASWELVAYAILGVLFGVCGAWYVRFLKASERQFTKIGVPIFARLAVGGLIVGLLALVTPGVYGNGFVPINDLFNSHMLWTTAAMILVFKLFATAATFGSGAVGGVFTPTIFVGAFLGYLFGFAVRAIVPSAQIDPLAFGLVGMGAFLTAATHAPLMAILMVVELTRDYQNILPIMIACVLAYYACLGAGGTASIYSESIKRKEREEGDREPDWEHSLVCDFMQPDPVAVLTNATFPEIAERFMKSRVINLYVVDDQKRFEGAISLHDVKPFLTEPELSNIVIARDIMHEDFVRIRPDSTFRDAMLIFSKCEVERLPVVAPSAEEMTDQLLNWRRKKKRSVAATKKTPTGLPGQLLGTISKADLILAIAATEREIEGVST